MIEMNGKSVELKDVSAVDLESESRDGTWAIIDVYDGEHIARDSYSRTENEGKKCRRYLLARTGADDAWNKVAKERDNYVTKWTAELNKVRVLEKDIDALKERVFCLQATLRSRETEGQRERCESEEFVANDALCGPEAKEP
jgi:hypothetical protein